MDVPSWAKPTGAETMVSGGIPSWAKPTGAEESSTTSKVIDAVKNGAITGLKGLDWASHLGQPDFAKKWVQSIKGDQQYASEHELMNESLADAMKNGLKNDAKSLRLIGSAGVDMATSPLSWLGAISKIPALSGMLESTALRTAAAATKISPEALTIASSPEGRTALKMAAGSEPTLAAKLSDIGNNARNYIPEHEAVRTAEAGAAPIDIRPTLQAFEDAKIPGRGPMGSNTGLDLKVNNRIQSELNAMRGNLPTPQQIADMDFKGNLEAAQAAIADPESKWGVLKSIADKASKVSDRANAVADQTATRASKSASASGVAKSAFMELSDKAGKNVTRFGTARDQAGAAAEIALEKARASASQAKEAYANAVAQSATSGVVSEDARTSKSALDAANKNFQLADATNEISQGKPLPQVARAMLDRHGLSGEELQNVIKQARNNVANNSFVPNYEISPEDFRKLKTSLGKDIQWDAPEATAYNNRMQSVYGKMKDQLVEAIRSSQGDAAAAKYAADLDSYSTKIGDFKELNKRLGNTPSGRLNRAEALIKAHDKTGNADLLSRIEQHSGEPITSAAKLAQMSKEFSENGKIPLAPVRSPALGATLIAGGELAHAGIPSELAKLYGLFELGKSGISSPAFSTRVLIPSSKDVGNGILKTALGGTMARTKRNLAGDNK